MVLCTYVENQAILEPILLYGASKSKQTKSKPIFLAFIRLLSVFFSFFCKDSNKTRSNCAIMGCNLSKKYKPTLYKTQNGEANFEILSFSLIFSRSYPYKTLGTDIQILQSWLVGWCMYFVTVRLHNIKLQCLLNTP